MYIHIAIHQSDAYLLYFLHKHQMKATKPHRHIQWAHMVVCNGQTDFAITLTMWPEKESYGCHTCGGGGEQTNYIFHIDYNVRVL